MTEKIINKLKRLFLPCEENTYRPEFLESRFLSYYAILLLVLKFAVIPFFVYLPKTGFFADITKTSLIQLANSDRQEAGILPLKESETLDQAAYLKAQDMLENDYFAHTSPEGTTPWYWFGEAGYNYRYAGENLAIGFLESEEVNQAWLESESHRKNIMNQNYTEIGLAVLSGDFQGRETTVVVQLFGQPDVVSPATKKQEIVVLPKESLPTSSVSSGNIKEETATGEVVVVQPKEVLSAFSASPEKGNMVLSFFSFVASDYYSLLQKINFASLIFIIFLLLNTVLFDIFVYRAYEIQHKDMLLKAVGFCLVLATLLYFDKGSVVQLIPHDFEIY
jgi:hypothetical protein